MISLNLREAEERARYWQEVNDRMVEVSKKVRGAMASVREMAENFARATRQFRAFPVLISYEARKAVAVQELAETLWQVQLQKSVKYRDVLEFCASLGVDPFGIRKELR